MLVVTVPEIPGYRIEAVLGEVVGVGLARIEAMGESSVLLIHRAREQATHEMWFQTIQRGANAVIGFNLQLARDERSFNVMAFGTAVSVVPISDSAQGATPQSKADAEQRASGAPQDAWQSYGVPSGRPPMVGPGASVGQPAAPAGPPPYGQPSPPGYGAPALPPPQGAPVHPAPPGYGQPGGWGSPR